MKTHYLQIDPSVGCLPTKTGSFWATVWATHATWIKPRAPWIWRRHFKASHCYLIINRIIHEMSLKWVSGNNNYKAFYTSFVLCVLLLVKMSSHSLIRLIYLLYVKKRAKENTIKIKPIQLSYFSWWNIWIPYIISLTVILCNVIFTSSA